MDDVKGVLQSKTIWGAVIAIAATGAQLAGWDIGDTGGLAEQVTAVIGGLLSIYGRLTAVKRIAS